MNRSPARPLCRGWRGPATPDPCKLLSPGCWQYSCPRSLSCQGYLSWSIQSAPACSSLSHSLLSQVTSSAQLMPRNWPPSSLCPFLFVEDTGKEWAPVKAGGGISPQAPSVSLTTGPGQGAFPILKTGSCSIHPHGAAFPCSLHASLTHAHCRAAGVQPIRGFICLFITEFVFISEVGIPSPYKQWTLWSRGLVITFSATCQTGLLRNVFKEGTCLSALLRQGRQACWGNVPACPVLLHPGLFTESFREWHGLGIHVKHFPKNWKTKTSPLEQRGRWWIVHLRQQDHNPCSGEVAKESGASNSAQCSTVYTTLSW